MGREFIREYQSDFMSEGASYVLTAEEREKGFQRIAIKTSENTVISGIYHPSTNNRFLIMLPGSGANGSTVLPEAQVLASAGFGIICLDLLAYREAVAQAGEEHSPLSAVTTAIGWIRDQTPSGQKASIGIYGFSMGAALALRAMGTEPSIQAIAVAGAMTSLSSSLIYQAGGLQYPWRYIGWLAANAFCGVPIWHEQPEDLIDHISGRPILLISGALDSTIPPGMTDTLFKKATEPKFKVMIPNARHGGYADAAPELFSKVVVAFFEHHLHPQN